MLYKPIVYNQNVVAYMNGPGGKGDNKDQVLLPKIGSANRSHVSSNMSNYEESPYKGAAKQSKPKGPQP